MPLLPCIEVFVWEYTIAEEHVEVRVCSSIDLEGGPSCLKRSFPDLRRLDASVSSELARNCRLSLNTRCSPQPNVSYFSIP